MPEEKILIRPQDFIRAPYIDCPQCSTPQSFGVIFVSDHSYTRRCKQCLASRPFRLPPLDRKIIYLDQFAISDLMKAGDPDSKARREGRLPPFWQELLAVLERLHRLQLIACPTSEFHEHESAVSPFREALRGLCSRFSAGVRFNEHISIEGGQIHEQVKRWVGGEDARVVPIERRYALLGDPTAWTDVFFVTVNIGDPEGYLDEVRRSRQEGEEFLRSIFDRWKQEQGTFQHYFGEESRRWGLAAPGEYANHLLRLLMAHSGAGPMTLDLAFPSGAVEVVRVVQHTLERAGVQPADIWPRTCEYLASDLLDYLPSNRLRASLWAVLASQAKDRSEPPNRGMSNDVQMLSTLLPYCDAMLIDRECHGLFKNIPASHRPQYPCKVFSASNKDAFLEYLREIEASVSTEHMTTLRDLYGDRIDQV